MENKSMDELIEELLDETRKMMNELKDVFTEKAVQDLIDETKAKTKLIKAVNKAMEEEDE